MATSKLDILVQVATRGTEKIKGLDQDLKRLDDSAGKTSTRFDKLAKFAVGAGAALGTVAIASKVAWDALKQGAELELARNRFDNLTASIGSTADAMLGRLRDATQGMATDAELIASANDIISLGLADTEDGVVRLANLVSQLGWDMQQVIMTFANNSKMRLDALGLSVEDVEKKAKALEEQGYSMDEAFDLAVIQAGEEKLALLGSAAETSAGKIKQLETGWKNFVEAVQLGIAEGAAEELDMTAEASQLAAEGAAELGRQLGQNLVPALLKSVPGLADLVFQLEMQAIQSGAAKVAAEAQAQSLENAWKATTGYGQSTEAAAVRVQNLASSLAAADQVLVTYIGYAERAAAASDRLAAKSMRTMSSENYKLSESLQISTRGLQVQNNVLNEYGEAANGATSSVGGLSVTIDESAEAMKRLDSATGDFFMRARGMEEWDPFENFAEILDRAGGNATTIADFLLASGKDAGKINEALGRTAVDTASQGIVDALMRGEVSAEEAAAQIGEIQAKFEGNTDAAREFLETIETPPEAMEVDADFAAAYEALDAFDSRLARGAVYSVRAEIGEAAGSTAGSGESGRPATRTDADAAMGANFIVPPGYHNDNYIVGVTSGEHVQVTPAGRRGGGDTYNIYNYNRQAAAITRAMFQLRRATGIDRRMGVMA